MKFDTTIATLTPAKYFAGKDNKGAFFVVKKNEKGNTRPVMPCPNGDFALMAANSLCMLEKMAVSLTLQVIAKARAV